MHSLETFKSLYNLKTEHDGDEPLNLSTSPAKSQKTLETHVFKPMGNQLIDRSPYIRYTNRKLCSLYSIVVLKYIKWV